MPDQHELDAHLAETAVIVPMFNEGGVISDVVQQLRESFPLVICIDDGSADNCGAVARAAGATVLRHAANLGQGAALQTGLTFAAGQPGVRIVVTYDADGQHQVLDARALIERLLADDLDIVFGTRFKDGRTEMSRSKRLVLKSAVGYTNMTAGVRLSDAHNGLRAMTVETARRLRITQNGMAHASEVVHQVGALGLRYSEVPVHILYTDYSRAKGQSLINSVNILFDLVFR